MVFPEFDPVTGLIPPFVGTIQERNLITPYKATISDLCNRFSTSQARINILHGLIALRQRLLNLGVTGFQWIDGSFLENVELTQSRSPNDIDIVTFATWPNDLRIEETDCELLDHSMVKGKYLVDHYLVPLNAEATILVDNARYWFSVFSHTRDSIWKGMLNIPLANNSDDDCACEILKLKF